MAGRLIHGPDFVQAVHEAAYRHTAEGTGLPPVRLSLALMAAGEGDPDVTMAISRAYEDYVGSWRGLYGQVMSAPAARRSPSWNPRTTPTG
ncbi:MAG TPA: hypothetical protein VK817_22430 [Trebonia sp.]|nr:hypothetical protein [Trebonia sp.]